MYTRARWLTPGLLVFTLACGHRAKIDTARLQAAHRIAVVGVCTTETWDGVAGLSDSFTATWGAKVLPSQAEAFGATLAQTWTGVEIVPLSQVVTRADLPKGASSQLCFGGLNTIDDKKRPDLALMKQLAAVLQVDAVLALWTSPSVTSRRSAHVSSGGTAYLADKEGQLIGTLKLKTVDSPDFEKIFGVGLVSTTVRDLSDDEFKMIGSSLGQGLANNLVQAVRAQ